MLHPLTQIVEDAATLREEPSIPRKFIEKALSRIDNGLELEDVECYPTGEPTLKGIYQVAARLEAAESTKQ